MVEILEDVAGSGEGEEDEDVLWNQEGVSVGLGEAEEETVGLNVKREG